MASCMPSMHNVGCDGSLRLAITSVGGTNLDFETDSNVPVLGTSEQRKLINGFLRAINGETSFQKRD
jgi:hypothetical protein